MLFRLAVYKIHLSASGKDTAIFISLNCRRSVLWYMVEGKAFILWSHCKISMFKTFHFWLKSSAVTYPGYSIKLYLIRFQSENIEYIFLTIILRLTLNQCGSFC